ncbi:ImuA family protein [Lichenicoccus sp.]|uniref:ImuA family protein n=1 Tax=Lichenicoccus sp. TaxID=2781899 RepID=UPI003D13EA29
MTGTLTVEAQTVQAQTVQAQNVQAQTVQALRLRIAAIERQGTCKGACKGARKAVDVSPRVRFGIAAIDDLLPDAGLAGGALHEVLGQGADSEHAALPSQLVGALLAPAPGQVLWAMRGRDLFAPALAAIGLHPDRLILVEAGSRVLDVMEEALRHPGLLGVVGEIEGKLGLTASRRLQLAAEASGAIGFAIRRSRQFDDPQLCAPSAAASRWRVANLPHGSPQASPERMLGPSVWRLDLLRYRGMRTALPTHWILERCDETHRLSLAAALADRPAVTRRSA